MIRLSALASFAWAFYEKPGLWRLTAIPGALEIKPVSIDAGWQIWADRQKALLEALRDLGMT